MTKRLIVAVVFLLGAFLISLICVMSVQNEIGKVLSLIEENDDIYECSEKILNLREHNEKVFSLFLKHTDADTIERLHYELYFAVNDRNDEKIKLLLAEIYAFLSVTSEGEKVKTENIF